jgi:hypothetical protein
LRYFSAFFNLALPVMPIGMATSKTMIMTATNKMNAAQAGALATA